MKRLVVLALAAIAGVGLLGQTTNRAAAASPLPRSSPEAQGVSSAALLEFVDAADRTIESMNSVMVLRHGQVIVEGWWAPYRAEAPHSLYSLSKSFTSTAVGLAIAEGKLSVDDEVLKFFPEDAPAEPSKNLKSMRVSDLLRMSTGHQAEPARPKDKSWVKSFLDQPVPFKPGTHFLYNTSATYMLSAIVQKATGETVLDYLRPRLFDPLGIEHPTWEASPQGITAGGFGLSLRTEDIARFGQLYLQKGEWQGKRLVPASWVEAATSRQTSNGSNPRSDWDQGYGYQFWRCRHGAFRGDGAFGQFCVVMPEQDAVLAITSGVRDLQGVLDLAWDRLLPAFKSDCGPLEEDESSRKALESRLGGLTLAAQKGEGSPSGMVDRKFVFPANDRKLQCLTLHVNADSDGTMGLIARVDGREYSVTCARGSWRPGRLAFGPLAEQPVAASGAWTGDDTYTARICFHETPFILKMRLKFSGDQLLLDSESNVGFGQAQHEQLVGVAE